MIKGMMKHGMKAWIKIYDSEPGLHHIKHSALKDRARSNRFKRMYERAQRDPTLLDRVDELCGEPNQAIYADDTPVTTDAPMPISGMPLFEFESQDSFVHPAIEHHAV